MPLGRVTVVSIGEVAFDLGDLGGLLRASVDAGGVGVQSGRLLSDASQLEPSAPWVPGTC